LNRTCDQTVMSGRESIGFVDFAVFSFAFDRLRCVFVEVVSGALSERPSLLTGGSRQDSNLRWRGHARKFHD